MNTFPFKYTFRNDVEKTPEYYSRSVKMESGKEQVQGVSTTKQCTWKINLQGDNNERLTLEAFFDGQLGRLTPFYFYDENGIQQMVRFADTKLQIKIIREPSKTSLTGGNPVGYTCDITLNLVV